MDKARMARSRITMICWRRTGRRASSRTTCLRCTCCKEGPTARISNNRCKQIMSLFCHASCLAGSSLCVQVVLFFVIMESELSFEIDRLKRVLEGVQERLRISETRVATLEEVCQELQKDVARLRKQLDELRARDGASDGNAASSFANSPEDRKASNKRTTGFFVCFLSRCFDSNYTTSRLW